MQNISTAISVFLEEKTIPHPEYQPIKLQDLKSVPDYFIKILHVNCLEYVNNPLALLENLCQKLANGGQIIIEGSEIYSICRNITVGIISLADVNTILYNGKVSACSIVIIDQFLSENGFKIMDRNIDNQRFMISGAKSGT